MNKLDRTKNAVDTFDIDKNTLRKIKVQDVARKLEIEIGDEKQSDKFYPQFKTKHWDNEANLSVRLIDDDYDNGEVKTKGEKIEWSRAGRTARFYEKDEAGEDGGFEFEVELDKKPASNILEFSIQTKGLRFLYQDDLTLAELEQGFVRPENVVGSYAVYHNSKKDDYSQVGGKNYKTGKAFHIYRPYAEDKTGNREWCELEIDEQAQILRVIVPQNFLDTAIYPIVIDPTFGYGSIGASTANLSTAGRLYAESLGYSPSSDGDADSMTGYIDGTGAENIHYGLYDDTDFVGNTDSASVPSSFAWVTANFSSPPSILSTVGYYLFFQVDTGSNAVKIRYDSGSDNLYVNNSSFGSFPDPITWTDTGGNTFTYSLYVTYSTGTETNDERDAEVSGKDTANDNRDAETTGAAAPVLTATQDGADIALSWTYNPNP